MESRHQGNSSPFSGTGEPRSGDIAITVLTALILLIVLAVLAVL
jgi:tetrahydromethanopterin S-methyltransferase subunit F